jgi:hypothetical protein
LEKHKNVFVLGRNNTNMFLSQVRKIHFFDKVGETQNVFVVGKIHIFAIVRKTQMFLFQIRNCFGVTNQIMFFPLFQRVHNVASLHINSQQAFVVFLIAFRGIDIAHVERTNNWHIADLVPL